MDSESNLSSDSFTLLSTHPLTAVQAAAASDGKLSNSKSIYNRRQPSFERRGEEAEDDADDDDDGEQKYETMTNMTHGNSNLNPNSTINLTMTNEDNSNNNNNNNSTSLVSVTNDLKSFCQDQTENFGDETKASSLSKSPVKKPKTPTKKMNPLHFQIKKLQKLLVQEQEKFSRLQGELQESENKRLDLISQNNKETFNLSTQFTKCRKELEKSEAMRQTTEYELSVARSQLNKAIGEKEKCISEIIRKNEEQINGLTRENTDLKAKLYRIESEKSKLAAFNKEQDNVINAIKEDNDNNKDSIQKLTMQIEFLKEKETKMIKEHEQLLARISGLEELNNKEKMASSDAKLNLELLQIKNKELEETIKSNENRNLEIEFNKEKLMDQLKENRKELCNEQFKSRELMERFKIIETQLRSNILELNGKLEEKTLTINNLSGQLSTYETSLFEIKEELNQTKQKQSELDKMYHTSMQDIEALNAECQFGPKDPEHESFKSFLANVLNKPVSKLSRPVVSPTISYSLETLKVSFEDFKKYFRYKCEELDKSKSIFDKYESQYVLYEKKTQECIDLMAKNEKECKTLREERVALEETIKSLRAESEELRKNLNREFDQNDTLKAQITRLSKQLKELQEKKSTLAQNIYKRLIPCSSKQHSKVFKPVNQISEADLDELTEKLVVHVAERCLTRGDKSEKIERDYAVLKEKYQALSKKCEEHSAKTALIMREKENHFIKQKSSLVNHYEQLLNDVNSRVKQSQQNNDETFEKLKESDHFTRNLEHECKQLKDMLNKSQFNQRNLTTSCLLLIGLLKSMLKKNNELKEQRRMFENLSIQWRNYQNQIRFLFASISPDQKAKRALKPTTNKPMRSNSNEERKRIQKALKPKDVLVPTIDPKTTIDEDIDYSITSSLLSSSTSTLSGFSKSPKPLSTRSSSSLLTESIEFSGSIEDIYLPQKEKTLRPGDKKQTPKICLFRKAVITVIAANRLIYFYNQSYLTSLSLKDSLENCYQYSYNRLVNSNQHGIQRQHQESLVSSSLNWLAFKTKPANEEYETDPSKVLFNWLTLISENTQLVQLSNISHELNCYLYSEPSFAFYTNSTATNTHSGNALKQVTRQTILKCLSLFEVQDQEPSFDNSKDSLLTRLKMGLDSWSHKNPKVALYYSFEKKLESYSSTLSNLNEDLSRLKNDNSVFKKKLQKLNKDTGTLVLHANGPSSNKTLGQDLSNFKSQNGMVPNEKFEMICSELENALLREQQAESILKQQTNQIENLTMQLSQLSYDSGVSGDQHMKDKMIRKLQKKVAELQSAKEAYESSACSILMDKDLFLNYCKNIENLVQMSLQKCLMKDSISFSEILKIVKQISSTTILKESSRADAKISPESLACQNLIHKLCDNYQIVLTKTMAFEEESGQLRKQLQYLLGPNNPQPNTMKHANNRMFTPIDQDIDVSFRKLPNYAIHDETNSAFKPLSSK